MENNMKAVADKITAAETVAILTHVNEDPDTLGSCFAFKKMMTKLGKKAEIYVSGKVEERLSFMGSDYIIYDESMKKRYDLCACIDCGDAQRIGSRKSLFNAADATINIDHHYTNTNFADANLVNGGASSAAEILTELFAYMKLDLDDAIAADLYTAICSDTGCFKFSSVTPKTMRMAADLLEYNFDHAEIARLLFDTESLAAARLKAEITGGIKSYADGKITLVTADEKDGEKYGIAPEDIPNLVEIPRRIEGAEIAVCVKKTSSGYRVNLRSNGDADVSGAAAAIGGGGHKKAAGGTIHAASMEDAEKIIIDECLKALEEMK